MEAHATSFSAGLSNHICAVFAYSTRCYFETNEKNNSTQVLSSGLMNKNYPICSQPRRQLEKMLLTFAVSNGRDREVEVL